MSQEYLLTSKKACLAIWSLSSLLFKIKLILSLKSVTLLGSNKIPLTSLSIIEANPPTLDAIIGFFVAKPSRVTSPNDSYSEGTTTKSDEL